MHPLIKAGLNPFMTLEDFRRHLIDLEPELRRSNGTQTQYCTNVMDRANINRTLAVRGLRQPTKGQRPTGGWSAKLL
jgi:hypothetical protein